MKIRKKKSLMNRPDYLTWEGGLLMQPRNARLAGVLPDSVKTVAWPQATNANRVVLPEKRIARQVVCPRKNARQEGQNNIKLFFSDIFNGKKHRLVKGSENH